MGLGLFVFEIERIYQAINGKRATGRLRSNGAVLSVLTVASIVYTATNRQKLRRLRAASRQA